MNTEAREEMQRNLAEYERRKMSTMVVTTQISYKYLMGKSKHDLARMVLEYADREEKERANVAVIKGYEAALDEIFKAYPMDVFPDTTQEERDVVIEQHPGFIDRTSAMMGRHISGVIKRRAKVFADELLEVE